MKMSYGEIIRDNCNHHSPVSWWPRFAYHYTDVTNAVGILEKGVLYSRARAESLHLMHNDNASRQVIDMTKTEARSCARFYFRPLTPTQYYNEGFKHTQLRYDQDENANTPVPIFFLFDLEKLLSLPGVQFSEQKQSGYGSMLKSGEEAFAKLNFDYIYSRGFENIGVVKSYRHAEILHQNSLNIDSCISHVLCRNDLERITLLNLLKKKSPKAFHKYKNIIKTHNSRDLFENNGMFITGCQYHDGVISVSFTDSYAKKDYIRRSKEKNQVETLKDVKVRLELDWLNARTVIRHSVTDAMVDYEKTSNLTFTSVFSVPNARTLGIKVWIEDKLMCYVEQSLEVVDIIK